MCPVWVLVVLLVGGGTMGARGVPQLHPTEPSASWKKDLGSPDVQEAVELAEAYGDFWDEDTDPMPFAGHVDAKVLARAETAAGTVPALMNVKPIDTDSMAFTPETPGLQRIWVGWFDHVKTLRVALIRHRPVNVLTYFHLEFYDGCLTSPPIFSETRYLSPTFLLELDQWKWSAYKIDKIVEPAKYYWLKMWFSMDEAGTVTHSSTYGVRVNYDQFVLGQLLTRIIASQIVSFPQRKRDAMFIMTGSLSEASVEKRRYFPPTNIACPATCLPVGTLGNIGTEKQSGPGSRMYHISILLVEDKTPPDWDPKGKDKGKVEGPDQPGSFDLHDENVVKQDILNMLEGKNGIANYEPFKSRWRSVDVYMAKVDAADDFATKNYVEEQDRFAKGMWGCANIDLTVELVTPYVPTGVSMGLANAVGSFSASVAYKTPGALLDKAHQAGHEMSHSLCLKHGWSLFSTQPKSTKFRLNWLPIGCLAPMGWCTESLTIEEAKEQSIAIYEEDPESWINQGIGDPQLCWAEAAQSDKDACHASSGCVWRAGLGADAFYEDYQCISRMIIFVNLCKEAATPEIKQAGCYVGPTGTNNYSPSYFNLASPIGGYLYRRDYVPGPPQSLNGFNAANAEQLHKLFTCVLGYRCRAEDWEDCQQFYSFWGDATMNPDNVKFIEKGLGCNEKTYKRR